MRPSENQLRAMMISALDGDAAIYAALLATATLVQLPHAFYRRRMASAGDDIEELEETLVADGLEDAANARMDMGRLLEVLPTKQSRAIRETRIEGLSISEAAARAGIGESDVEVLVHRGLKNLVARIARDRR